MERDRDVRADELFLGPDGDARRPRAWAARGLPVVVLVATLVAAAVSAPGLLSGSPAPEPAPKPSASASVGGDAATATWTGDASRAPQGNAFVQSTTRLLRLPAT